MSYPHGDTNGTVHVAFVEPALFGDAPLLGAEGGRVLDKQQIKGSETYTGTRWRLCQTPSRPPRS